jgi:hypothetical protein
MQHDGHGNVGGVPDRAGGDSIKRARPYTGEFCSREQNAFHTIESTSVILRSCQALSPGIGERPRPSPGMFPLTRHRKTKSDLTTATSLQGPQFCLRAEAGFLDHAAWAATSFDDQLNSVPSIHIRCRITASFRFAPDAPRFERRPLCNKGEQRVSRFVGAEPLRRGSFAASHRRTSRFGLSGRSRRMRICGSLSSNASRSLERG